MRQALINGLTGVVLVMFAVDGSAQDARKEPPATQRRITEAVKTGKERLSDKASDDQRVDNCKVPRDRRGAKLRPEGCGPANQ